MHSIANLDVGQLRYWTGPSAASDAFFHIEFHGKQAHAAFPQESIDPVIMAAEAVLELQTIRTRNLAAGDAAVMSVATVNAGIRPNIIPDHADLAGIVRTFDDRVDATVERRMSEIVSSIAQGAGGSADIRFYNRVPVLVSDPALVERMVPAFDRAVGKSNVALVQPVPAADDFAFFGRQAPEFFFQLGTQKPGTLSGFNHTPHFAADDASISVGMRAMTEVLLAFLHPSTTH